jgi:dihydroxycyclohexadiene carboxylate dehydrogenase
VSAALARFSGRVAVVTGAAQGIGYACAERIGQEGGCILVADIAEGPARAAVEMLRSQGIEARAICADMAQPVAAEAVMARASQEFGRLDVVVNNVGGTIWKKPFWHYSDDEIRQEVERSFWPMMWTAHAAVRAMRERGGSIVNIGSNAVDGVYRVPYSACKGAVAALTTALASETAHLGIRVNCVALGGTTAPERKTPRLARELNAQEQEWERQFLKLIEGEDLMGRFARAEEQAAVVAFLASDDASHLTGEIINTGRRGRRLSDHLEQMP